MSFPTERHVGLTWLRALALLATIPDGLTEDLLVLYYGFDRSMIAALITEGFATTIGVRVKISDIGRKALESS